MKALLSPPTEPRDRLQWITRYSPAYHRELHGPRYLIAPALLAVLLLIVVLAISIGGAAVEMFTIYSNWLRSLASPV
jgi:hypothetical protein